MPDTSEQSVELFRLVVENVEDFAVYTKDLEGRILSWNPGVERLLGYTEGEWVGRHISIIFTPEDLQRGELERELGSALERGRAEDQRWHVRRDGSRFWANGLLMLLRDEAGAPRGFAKIMRDDTARKLAEDARRESEQRMRHLLSNIPGGSINVFDRELRYLFAEGRGLADAGLSPEMLVGRTLSELFPAEAVEYVTPYYRRALEGEAVDFELEVGGRWYIINAAPFMDADGRAAAVIALAQEITGRRRMEEELRLAHDEMERRVEERTSELQELTETLLGEVKERAAAEGRVRGLMGRVIETQELERKRIARDLHDNLGQQLTALRLRLASLAEKCGSQPELREEAAQAQELLRRLDEEVDFIAWELRPAAIDEVGLPAALENFVHEWSEHYGIPAEYRDAGLGARRVAPEVEVNLYRIMQEALNNVYKHAGATRTSVLVERRDDHLVLIVEDDGRGFHPGRAVDGEKGMGLLSMKERAALVGGTLEIESAPGAGTTLYVTVPARYADAGPH